MKIRFGDNRNRQWLGGLLLVALVAVVAVGQWRIHVRRQTTPIAVVHRPRAIMGTTCTLAAVVFDRDRARAEEALAEAEAVLREVEAHTSNWLDDSEISRLNAAEAGEQIPLGPDALGVLRRAQTAAIETHGAFDVTCGPLVQLWRQAGRRDKLPSPKALDEARTASNWNHFTLSETGATKSAAEARVDLGGIAKGYAIDRAVAVLESAGLVGGMVDVGGDVRCFGREAVSKTWSVDVQNPFVPGRLVELRIPAAAVATSGNYARFVEIDGRRYSHIIDPRTGEPAEAAASATVIAPDAMTADIWATALSVLGPDGFALLPEGVEAMLVSGGEDDFQIHSTDRFRALMVAKTTIFP